MSGSSGNDIFDTVFSLHESWLTEEECLSQLYKCVKDAGHWALETLKSRIRQEDRIKTWESTTLSLIEEDVYEVQSEATNSAYQARIQFEKTISLFQNLFEHRVDVCIFRFL